LAKTRAGGLIRFDEGDPAYLPAAGNDFTFASGLEVSASGERDISVMGSLRARCSRCHGSDVAVLFTFSQHDPEIGQIKILNSRKNEHAQYVVERKTKLPSWKSLRGQLQEYEGPRYF